jgi:hypothetical protein
MIMIRKEPQIVTKYFRLRFNGSSKATAKINVPFKVCKIITKHIVYQDDIDPVVTPIFGVLVSTQLVKEQPLGLFNEDYRNTNYAEDIIYKTLNPIPIAGEYTFNAKTIADADFVLSGDMIVILEFNEYCE